MAMVSGAVGARRGAGGGRPAQGSVRGGSGSPQRGREGGAARGRSRPGLWWERHVPRSAGAERVRGGQAGQQLAPRAAIAAQGCGPTCAEPSRPSRRCCEAH